MARRSGFGIFEAGTATGYVAGWCPHCGRRRGNDGRCADCDPWFTSPLVQYGGPIVGAFTVFLIAGTFLIGARNNANTETVANGNNAGVLGAPSVAGPSFPLNAMPQFPTVQPIAPPMPRPPDPASMAASFTPYIYSPDAHAYAEADNLRQMAAWTDWQVDTLRREQEDQQRLSNSGGGAYPNAQSSEGVVQGAEVM